MVPQLYLNIGNQKEGIPYADTIRFTGTLLCFHRNFNDSVQKLSIILRHGTSGAGLFAVSFSVIYDADGILTDIDRDDTAKEEVVDGVGVEFGL